MRLALAVELPWLTLLPCAEDVASGRAWVPFQLPPGVDGERFAAAIQAERLPIELWETGRRGRGAGAVLALPIRADYDDEAIMQLPLAVAKVAHYLLHAGRAAPSCPVPTHATMENQVPGRGGGT